MRKLTKKNIFFSSSSCQIFSCPSSLYKKESDYGLKKPNSRKENSLSIASNWKRERVLTAPHAEVGLLIGPIYDPQRQD